MISGCLVFYANAELLPRVVVASHIPSSREGEMSTLLSLFFVLVVRVCV